MNWLQIILLILKLLQQAKQAESAESFAASADASALFPQANGDLLKWFWENREAIFEFISKLIGMIPDNPPATTMGTASDDEIAEVRSLLAELQD